MKTNGSSEKENGQGREAGSEEDVARFARVAGQGNGQGPVIDIVGGDPAKMSLTEIATEEQTLRGRIQRGLQIEREGQEQARKAREDLTKAAARLRALGAAVQSRFTDQIALVEPEPPEAQTLTPLRPVGLQVPAGATGLIATIAAAMTAPPNLRAAPEGDGEIADEEIGDEEQ